MTAPRWFWWLLSACAVSLVCIAAQALRAARFEPVSHTNAALAGYEHDRWTGEICRYRRNCGETLEKAQSAAVWDSAFSADEKTKQ